MTVNDSKRRRLEAKGWKLGDAQEFLDLSDEEMALIEMKLALGRDLKERRQRKRLSQAEFARRISSSQSRVAKMEAGDATVSMDLLIRSLLALGVSRKDVARSIQESRRRAA
jgi:ribosome-binding protein aMBF1 (putative translation factor)